MASLEQIRRDGESEAAKKQARAEMLDGTIAVTWQDRHDLNQRIRKRAMEIADSMQQDRFRRPHYAVCSAGKDRWFWLAERHHLYWDGQDGEGRPPSHRWPEIGSGYAPDRETALHLAREAAGPDGLETDPGYAAVIHKERAKTRRMERAAERNAGDSGAGVQEYVYSVAGGPYGDHPTPYRIVRHPILRRTARCVFVERRGDPTRPAIRLDRQRLERDGSHKAGPNWWDIWFYLDPPDLSEWNRADGGGTVPVAVAAALTRLELDHGAGADDIERAYRRMAKQAHPDRGGDADGFVAVRAAYETAIAHARGGRP